MTDLTLRELTLAELKTLHETELHEAFPPEELKPFAAMERLVKAGVYHPMGAWEGETLVGYALLWESDDGDYILLDYLGVTASRRNGGLGGRLLASLGRHFPCQKGILIESEAPEGGPTDALRRRRLAFYQRNGCLPLSYACILFGVHYAMLLLPIRPGWTEAEVLAAHQGVYRSQLPPAAYEKFVQIPRDPAHPLQVPNSWAEQTDLPQ